MRLFISILLIPAMLSGCASYSSIRNRSNITEFSPTAYSLRNARDVPRSSEITLALVFSGGGTRAAALAYGVLEELRDTAARINGQTRRLLDEVDLISSVSGGSFTAAYYGLNGDGLFSEFEQKFLRRNVSGELLHGLLNPTLWFSSRARTEMAIEFYEKSMFKGTTFADLQRSSGPLIVINASDLGRGVRFSFLQEYFDLL